MPTTESADPLYTDIDIWPASRAITAMLDGQVEAIMSIRPIVPLIALASDAGAQRLRRGGRIFYVGAGTSGRIAVQDGVELGPTYGWPTERTVFMMAGGIAALTVGVEGAEDDRVAAQAELHANGIGPDDVLIGVAASGKTPYTLSAIEVARTAGALTIGVANNLETPILTVAEFGLCADTGSEIVAGSTRMKAGTAQKAILNLLSTSIMIQLGHVYRGMMVDMVISNAKLLRRAQEMVATLSGCDESASIAALAASENDIKTAILIASGLSLEGAHALLQSHGGNLRTAMAAYKIQPV